MTYAREHGIWPRPAPKPAPEPGSGPDVAGPTPGGLASGQIPIPGPVPPTGFPKPDSKPTAKGPFTHEGVLREALKVVWEKARSAGAKKIGVLSIRLFEQVDAFRMLAIVGGVGGAKVQVEFDGHYGTEAGGEFEYQFRGPVEDALPVKDFLGPQYRAAADRLFNATFTLTFATGLSLEGDPADKLAERLTQQSMGAAYVTASAEAQP